MVAVAVCHQDVTNIGGLFIQIAHGLENFLTAARNASVNKGQIGMVQNPEELD